MDERLIHKLDKRIFEAGDDQELTQALKKVRTSFIADGNVEAVKSDEQPEGEGDKLNRLTKQREEIKVEIRKLKNKKSAQKSRDNLKGILKEMHHEIGEPEVGERTAHIDTARAGVSYIKMQNAEIQELKSRIGHLEDFMGTFHEMNARLIRLEQFNTYMAQFGSPRIDIKK